MSEAHLVAEDYKHHPWYLDVDGQAAWITSLCFVVVASIITFANITMHLRNYTRPAYQRYTIRILLIIPVYGLGGFMALYQPANALYYDTLKDIYEAYVIYCFLTFMLAVTGGESNCVDKIAVNPGMIKHPFPFCWLKPIHTRGLFIRYCKQGTLQFVIVKPLTAVLSLAMLGLGLYEHWAYQTFLVIVYNVSYTVALYFLMLFYMAAKLLLKPCKPVQKFVSVKTIVFMTFWQALVISLIPNLTKHEGHQLNNIILCVEMLVFAIMQARAFSYKEYISDIVVDTTHSMIKNVKEVLNIADVYEDMQNNFLPQYHDYVLQHHVKEGTHVNPHSNPEVTNARVRQYIYGEKKNAQTKKLTEKTTQNQNRGLLRTRIDDEGDEDGEIELDTARRKKKGDDDDDDVEEEDDDDIFKDLSNEKILDDGRLGEAIDIQNDEDIPLEEVIKTITPRVHSDTKATAAAVVPALEGPYVSDVEQEKREKRRVHVAAQNAIYEEYYLREAYIDEEEGEDGEGEWEEGEGEYEGEDFEYLGEGETEGEGEGEEWVTLDEEAAAAAVANQQRGLSDPARLEEEAELTRQARAQVAAYVAAVKEDDDDAYEDKAADVTEEALLDDEGDAEDEEEEPLMVGAEAGTGNEASGDVPTVDVAATPDAAPAEVALEEDAGADSPQPASSEA